MTSPALSAHREALYEATDRSTKRRPSIAQMRARVLSVHLEILNGLSIQDRYGSSPSPGTIRGWSRARATLVAWGCIEGSVITDRGRELLAVSS